MTALEVYHQLVALQDHVQYMHDQGMLMPDGYDEDSNFYWLSPERKKQCIIDNQSVVDANREIEYYEDVLEKIKVEPFKQTNNE